MVAKKKPEVVEVEAEIVEDDVLAPKPVYVPAVIDAKAYLAAKGDYVEHMMEPYADMDEAALEAMDLSEMKTCRADLNRIIKEVEDERKAIKKMYNEPLKAFEAKVAEMLEPVRKSEELLAGGIKAIEASRKELRRQSLEGEYEIFAPALVPVVPFDRILAINPKWLNASYNGVKATEEMEDAVAKIARDWDALKKQAHTLPFYQEAEAAFFRTLDLGAALDVSRSRAEEQARIDALKAEVDGDVEYEAAPATCEADEYAPPHPVHAEPQPNGERRLYRFSAWLSDSEVASLREWKNALNIGADWKFAEVKDV